MSVIRGLRHWEWVENHIDRKLYEPEQYLINIVCFSLRRGAYDFSGWDKRLKTAGMGARYSIRDDLSTFDCDSLTRIVFAAHEASCRVSVQPCNMKMLEIELHIRQRGASRNDEGLSMFMRHPSLEDSVSLFNETMKSKENSR